jgi:hypothetical protein
MDSDSSSSSNEEQTSDDDGGGAPVSPDPTLPELATPARRESSYEIVNALEKVQRLGARLIN